ncbi:MAG: polyphenol oxidase family protein [bacterium]|nr:polyphenol oxidase family protein [bacterium]
MLVLPLSPGARAVFTTRSGGVSIAPYGDTDGGGGLNLGGHVGDTAAAVEENRRRLSSTLSATLKWMDQVHGDEVRVLEAPSGHSSVGVVDGLVLGPRMPAHAPGVLVADCVPVLLASESGTYRGAVHVGRAGLFRGILPRAVETVAGLSGEPVHVVTGPHICGACYEVSEELASQAEPLGAGAATRWGTPSINLLAGIRRQLAGVFLLEAGVCTLEDDRFFSYRRDGVTGRCAGITLGGASDTPMDLPGAQSSRR